MTTLEENQQLKILLGSADSLSLVVAPNAAADGLYAALALKEVFTSQGKLATVVYPSSLPPTLQNLPEAKEVKENLAESSLVISLDTVNQPIGKVSYFMEGTLFNLVIGPVSRNFEVANIKPILRAQKIDLIITLGALRLEDLSKVYSQNQEELTKNAILNIDNHNENTHFGTLDVIDPLAKSLCEMIFYKLAQWEMRPNTAAAKWLTLGFS
jgi:nanoRNase/pAp phosphatase (c-di-AMP/oligoRNAs hydrolase)